MKTILQALADEIPYPLGLGFLGNRLLARGIDGDEAVNMDVLNSKEFIGAKADCLFSLVEAPNFSESDISISLQNRDLILKKANYLYSSIGEEEKSIDQPTVYAGPPPGIYVSY